MSRRPKKPDQRMVVERRVSPRFAKPDDTPLTSAERVSRHQGEISAGRAEPYERFSRSFADDLRGFTKFDGKAEDYYWGPFDPSDEREDDAGFLAAETIVSDGHPLFYLAQMEDLDEILAFLARYPTTSAKVPEIARAALTDPDDRRRFAAQRLLDRIVEMEFLRARAVTVLAGYAITTVVDRAMEGHPDAEQGLRSALALRVEQRARANLLAQFDQPASPEDFIGSTEFDLTEAQVSARLKSWGKFDTWTFRQWFSHPEALDFLTAHGLEGSWSGDTIPEGFYESLPAPRGIGVRAKDLRTWIRTLLPFSDPAMAGRASVIRLDDIVLVDRRGEPPFTGEAPFLAQVVGFAGDERVPIVHLRRVVRNRVRDTIRIGKAFSTHPTHLDYVQRGVRLVESRTKYGALKFRSLPFRKQDWDWLRLRELEFPMAGRMEYARWTCQRLAPPPSPSRADLRVDSADAVGSMLNTAPGIEISVAEVRTPAGMRLKIPGVPFAPPDRAPDPSVVSERMRLCRSSYLLFHSKDGTREKGRGCDQVPCPACARSDASDQVRRYLPRFIGLARLGYNIVHLTLTQPIWPSFGRPVVLSELEMRRLTLADATIANEYGFSVPGESLAECLARNVAAWNFMRTGSRPLVRRWDDDVLGGVYGIELTTWKRLPDGRYLLRWHVHRHLCLVVPPGIDLPQELDPKGYPRISGAWMDRRRADWGDATEVCGWKHLERLRAEGSLPFELDADPLAQTRPGVLVQSQARAFPYAQVGRLVTVRDADGHFDEREVERVLRETLKYSFKHGEGTEAQILEQCCVLKGQHLHDAYGIFKGNTRVATAARAMATQDLSDWNTLLAAKSGLSDDERAVALDYATVLRQEREAQKGSDEDDRALRGLLFSDLANTGEASEHNPVKVSFAGTDWTPSTRKGVMFNYADIPDGTDRFVAVRVRPADVSLQNAVAYLRHGGRWYPRPPPPGVELRPEDVVAGQREIEGPAELSLVGILRDVTTWEGPSDAPERKEEDKKPGE